MGNSFWSIVFLFSLISFYGLCEQSRQGNFVEENVVIEKSQEMGGCMSSWPGLYFRGTWTPTPPPTLARRAFLLWGRAKWIPHWFLIVLVKYMLCLQAQRMGPRQKPSHVILLPVSVILDTTWKLTKQARSTWKQRETKSVYFISKGKSSWMSPLALWRHDECRRTFNRVN